MMTLNTLLLLLLVGTTGCLLLLRSYYFLLPVATGDSPNCRIHLQDGILSVDGQDWFKVGRACYRKEGRENCEGPWTPSSTRGTDALGPFLQDNFVVGDDEWQIWRRSYDQDSSTMMFGQTYRKEVKGTNYPAGSTLDAANQGIASWFPSFQVHGDQVKGFLELAGIMAGSYARMGPVSQLNDTQMAFEAGPMAFFNQDCIVVMSPASSFMSTSSQYRTDKEAYGFGVLGSVPTTPQGHELSILVSSTPRRNPDGIRQAFLDWGAKLMRLHNTQRPSDYTTQHLQYSTDNGAFYYYKTEPNRNYEQTILDIKQQADKLQLPFVSWLMDSWWYYQGKGHGVTQWTAKPNIFPNGIPAVTNATKWAIVAHNRYWAKDTVYAKQNGGNYDFVIEEESLLALPLEQRFWNDLLEQSKLWGLTVYEQDWLNWQTERMNHTLQHVDHARTWMLQMGNAAQLHGIPIQYCMSYPRHILQSLEVNYVTQARASGDYQPSKFDDNWNIGISSIFLSALNIAPLKDNFWSSSNPQNRTYGDYNYEIASRLHGIISAYSTGAVAPSDSIDQLNATRIMKSCRRDGRLLQPDIPAVPIDATILETTGILPSTSSVLRHVWSTHTELSGYNYTYILSIRSPSFHITEEDLYPNANPVSHVAWEVDAGPIRLLDFPIKTVASDITDAHLYAIAPVFFNGYALLGEAATKWVPVSRSRFSNLQLYSEGFSVNVAGEPSEVVQIVVLTVEGSLRKIPCMIPDSGMTGFSTSDMDCK